MVHYVFFLNVLKKDTLDSAVFKIYLNSKCSFWKGALISLYIYTITCVQIYSHNLTFNASIYINNYVKIKSKSRITGTGIKIQPDRGLVHSRSVKCVSGQILMPDVFYQLKLSGSDVMCDQCVTPVHVSAQVEGCLFSHEQYSGVDVSPSSVLWDVLDGGGSVDRVSAVFRFLWDGPDSVRVLFKQLTCSELCVMSQDNVVLLCVIWSTDGSLSHY